MTRKTVARAVVAGCATPYMWRHDTGRRDKHSNIVWEYHLNVTAGTRYPRPRVRDTRDRGYEVPTKKTTPEDHIEDKSLSRSPQAATEREPHEFPDDWQPNHTHRAVAGQLGIDIEDAIDAFMFTDAPNIELRTNWDRTFGAFLNEYADGRADDRF